MLYAVVGLGLVELKKSKGPLSSHVVLEQVSTHSRTLRQLASVWNLRWLTGKRLLVGPRSRRASSHMRPRYRIDAPQAVAALFRASVASRPRSPKRTTEIKQDWTRSMSWSVIV